jgi:hypothetical protein
MRRRLIVDRRASWVLSAFAAALALAVSSPAVAAQSGAPGDPPGIRNAQRPSPQPPDGSQPRSQSGTWHVIEPDGKVGPPLAQAQKRGRSHRQCGPYQVRVGGRCR